MTGMQWQFPIELPVVPMAGDRVVIPESLEGERGALTVRGDVARLAAPKDHFEVTLDDGRKCVVAWRVADSGAGGHWFVARWV